MKKNVTKILFLLFCSITFYCNVYCIELNFRSYMVENGLSSNTVYDIIQDSEGYIWIGTENGLNRFDGYEFRNFIHVPRDTTSIVNNYVYCLFEDSDRMLWIGTQQGVSIYDLQSKRFRPFNLQTKEGVSVNDRIQNIFADEKGRIWISSYNQGIFVYDKQNGLKRYSFDTCRENANEITSVTCIYKDRDNTIWASVKNSKYWIYKLDNSTNRFAPAFPDTDIEILRKLVSYSILEDTFGMLWFGTWTNGLYAVDKKRGIKGNYLNTEGVDKIMHIHSITEYEPGNLLIGSNDGLTSFNISPTMGNRKDTHLKEPILSNRFVYPIYKDTEGGLWIGTYYGGINYASPNRNYFTSYTHDKYENSISGNVVSDFCEDKSGNLWIGTDDGGLNYFDTKTGRFSVYQPQKGVNSLSYHNVHALCIDGNNLWIGTYSRGLNIMDLSTKKFKHYYTNPLDSTTLDANNIYALYKDSRNNMWIGTTSGINLYDRQKDNFRRMMAYDAITIDIQQVGNIIWFATIGKGLYAYNLDTKQWRHYKFETDNIQSLLSDDVICLCLDQSDQLWIGTISGLCRFDSSSQSFIKASVNFQSNAICNIFSDNNHLWITTTKGLVWYEPQKDKYRLFTKGDGLLSDQFTPRSGIKAASGRIYVGTATGFNAFYPKQIIENRHIPAISITDFQLFNKSVDINDYISDYSTENVVRALTLPHNKNAFSFEYTALSYFASEKNEYAFMLEGFDKGWNYVGKVRKATYTNIPPGEYYFKVKASNNDGIWNDSGLVIKIIITRPFWWNIWSIFLYIILVITLLILLLNFQKKREDRKSKEKIDKIKADQEKESYDSKISFFTNIAHEIRTPVSLIIGPLEQITKNNHLLPADIVNDLTIIDRNSQRLLSLVNQLLDFRKIERQTIQITLAHQNIYEFLLGVYDRFKPFIEHKNIRFIYTYNNRDFHTSIDVENLTKVVSNLLNNASKYTKDYIELNLDVNIKANKYSICVSDNGIGIPSNEQQNIFKPFYQISGSDKSGTGIGLYLVKSIVDASDGKIKIESEAGKGLSILIELPIIKESNNEEQPAIELAVSSEKGILDVENIDIESHETDETTSDEKPTLLIVEDNIDMQYFLHKNLTASHHVLVANNGLEGIKILEKNEVDIIISDIMMPQMDGIEFCHRVKISTLWNHIPLVLLTAKTNIPSKIEALEIGADAYIEKPFSMSYLSAQINNLLESRKSLLKKFSETPFISLKSIAGNKADEEFLAKLHDIIERNISNVDFSIEQLAEELCISNSGLFARIKNLAGTTPNKLLLIVRLRKGAELLVENKYRVNEVCYMIGFNSPSYFAKCFQKQYGVLPKDFRDSRQ